MAATIDLPDDADDTTDLPHARDATETRRQLRRHPPDELRQMEDRIQTHLDEVEDRIDAAREKVRDRVTFVLDRYGDDVAAEREARRVVRGKASDPLNDVLRDLERRAKDAEDEKWATVYRGRVQETTRMVERLRSLEDRRDKLRHRLRVAERLLTDWSAGETELGVEAETEEGEHTPTRRTKRRVVIAHRITQNQGTTIEERSDLNRLLREFMEWDGDDPPKRPADAIFEAVDYAPGRGKGDFEEALEQMHERVSQFEADLGERIVENLERLVRRWAEERSRTTKNG